MRFVYLNNQDLRRAGLEDWPKHYQAVRQALAGLGSGTASVVPSTRLTIPGADRRWTVFTGAVHGERPSVALKWLTRVPSARRSEGTVEGLLVLSSGRTGDVLAVMQAGILTAVRTAVTSAIAADVLVQRIATLAILGTGVVGGQHVRCFSALRRDIRRIILWNRTRPAPDDLAALHVPRSIPLTVADTLQEAVAAADTIVCAFASQTPLVRAEWVNPGASIIDVGEMTCETSVLTRVQGIYLDTLHPGVTRGGHTVGRALAEGSLRADQISGGLAEILASGGQATDHAPGVFFDSAGLAIEDVAVALSVYDEAQRLGLGVALSTLP